MKNHSSKTYAVVTGASRGLGKYLALELAKRNINTILVGLPHENIHTVAEESKALGVESYFYETDLSKKENILQLTHWVNTHFRVNILINNAGRGGTISFRECDADYIDSIIQLNVAATSIITHQLLPNLLQQKQSYILNVSSMASFSPIGYKTVYPASKKFIQHFTRGLYQELKNTNVFVSVVHPGSMKTNADVTGRIERQGKLGRIGLVTPEKVAEITIRQLFKKDSLILVGWSNNFNWLLMVLLPIWIRLPLLTRIVQREIAFKQNKTIKMKKLYLGMAALLIAGICHAQTSFGVRAGTTFSNIVLKQSGNQQETKLHMGAMAGIYANLSVTQKIYIQPSLQFEMKGGEVKATSRKTKLSYLTLPIDLLYKQPVGSNTLLLGAGPYFGYGISGKITGGHNDVPAKNDLFKIDDGLKRFDAGIHAQVAYEFMQGLNIGMQVEYGVLNLQENGNSDNSFRNISYSLSLGYTFGQ